MSILRASDGRQIKTRPGIQVEQYVAQMKRAGFFAPVIKARGLERANLERSAAVLVSYLRSGEVSQRSKLCAARLGLTHIPDNAEGLK